MFNARKWYRLYTTISKDLLQTSETKISQIHDTLGQIQSLQKFKNMPLELSLLKKELLNDSIWSTNQKKAIQLQTRSSHLSDTLTIFEQYQTKLKDLRSLFELAQEQYDNDLMQELTTDIDVLNTQVTQFFLKSMMNDDTDPLDCFIELRAGSGGTESCDWVQIISRMYVRWAQSQNYTAQIINFTAGEVAGYKNATVQINGPFAFGWAKFEAGVHRFVRISPFDSNGKRHTSFISVQVLPLSSSDDEIIELDPKDLKIEVMRAQGAGGQHVNKTESAVRVTHLPTNIVVFSQNERSQHLNKASALTLLKSKLYTRKLQEKSKEKKEMYEQLSENTWGSQVRSYVLQPYRLIKDAKSGYQTSDVDGVLDGDVQPFMQAALLKINQQ